MMRRRLQIEDLRTCLSYDSEVKRFLNLSERCLIHKNQVQIIDRSYPLSLSPELKEKIKQKLCEIRRRRWHRPYFRFENEWGTIKKVRVR